MNLTDATSDFIAWNLNYSQFSRGSEIIKKNLFFILKKFRKFLARLELETKRHLKMAASEFSAFFLSFSNNKI